MKMKVLYAQRRRPCEIIVTSENQLRYDCELRPDCVPVSKDGLVEKMVCAIEGRVIEFRRNKVLWGKP